MLDAFCSIVIISWALSCGALAVDLHEIAFSTPWLKLLHYKSYPLFGFRSSLSHDKFFISTSGRFDPLAELEESISLLKSNQGKWGRFKQSPRCVWPARFHFLQERGVLSKKLK